jgi:hypothetical protein
MAGRLPPLGAAVDVTCPPTYSVWRAVVVRHVSDAHVEVRFHHWDGGLDETEDDMVVPATDTWPASQPPGTPAIPGQPPAAGDVGLCKMALGEPGAETSEVMQRVRVMTIKEDGTLGTLSVARPAPACALFVRCLSPHQLQPLCSPGARP